MLEPGIIHDIRDTEVVESKIKIAQEQLEEVEGIRLIKLKTYKRRKRIGIPLAAVLSIPCALIDFFLLAMKQSNDGDGGAGVTVLVMGLIYAWVTQPKRDYTKAYKMQLMPKIVEAFGNFKYNLKGKIDDALMKPSKILPRYDKYKSEDHFEGHYKGSHIQFCEINLKQRRRSRKRTRYVSVFKGLAILLESKNRTFYGHTILTKDSSKLMEWFKEKSSDLKRANLVDPEFEDMFDVYTNDQVEARYLVDPKIMEQLKKLSTLYNGKSLSAAYYDQKFLILIESKENHFEPPGIHVPATSRKSLEELYQEIESILNIGDVLELYDPKAVHNKGQTPEIS